MPAKPRVSDVARDASSRTQSDPGHRVRTRVEAKAGGAGVSRWKPNIRWAKDRGKNPPGSPWGEDRDNDKHRTLAMKRAARVET